MRSIEERSILMIFKREVEIRVTRDLEELNKVRDILSKNGIRTSVITNTHINPGRHHGVPFIDPDAAYQYQIFAARKDEKRALEILRGI